MSNSDELKHHAGLLKTGRMSRREFVARAAALGVTVPLATAIAADVGYAAAPKTGGRFRMALGGGASTDTLNPTTFSETYMQTLGYGLRNCLAEMNQNDELVPELAESWEASTDAKTWKITLRQGVEFHNGKTFDADDAIASLQLHLGPDTSSPAAALLKTVESVEKDGNNAFVVKLSEGNVGFPALLTDYHIVMMPAVDGVLDIDSGTGTGAFSLKEFKPGVSALLERNPNYWKEGAGHFDEVELLSVKDVNARTNSLVAGDVHAADRLDLKTLKLFQRSQPDIKIHDIEGSQWYGFPMMVDRDPFTDNNVRLALKHAINREQMLETLLFGHGSVANDNPIGKSYKYYTELPQNSYDPDKAKFYLKEAGLSELSVQLHAANAAFAGAVDAATLFSEGARAAGITLEPVRTPDDGYWGEVNRVVPWSATYWNPRVTEDMMFSMAFTPDAPWNESNWSNDRFNALLKDARLEFDEAKRGDMYAEMQKICTEENGYIIPLFANFVFATSKDVQFGNIATSWDLDGTKALERWWMA